MLNMYTVSDVAQAFNVSKQTGRYWTAEFQDYLDPAATPAKGKPRQFTEADMTVFALVAEMREKDSASYDDIHAALAAGERGELPDMTQATQEPGPAAAAGALVPLTAVEQFTRQITQQYQHQIDAIEDERDHLRKQLQEERDARLEAEKGRTAAETELRVMKEQRSQEEGREGSQEDQGERRPGLLDRLFGR